MEIKVPSLGESIVDVVVGTFLKKEGEYVRLDEEIVEVQTDKVNQVLYAPASGVIHWGVKEGDTVSIGGSLGSIKEKKMQQPLEKENPAKEIDSIPEPVKQKTELPQKTTSVVLEVEEMPQLSQENVRRKKMSPLRRKIAERLLHAVKSTASLTTFNEVDLTEVIHIRERDKVSFQERYGVKLGFMSFFVKAVISALKEYPLFNQYIDGEEIVEREDIDISVAVSTDRGLVVPVIRKADLLSAPEIEKAIERYAERAREGKITLDEISGGSFTITNGGVFGSLLSTPILNPPQVGILGMHKIQKRAVVINDEVVVRPMMYLALTYDHRLIDGKQAVEFLVHIKNYLENVRNDFI